MSAAELESISNAQVEALVAAARDLVTRTRDSNAVAFLSQWPVDEPVSRVIAPRALPVLQWLHVAPPLTVAATCAFVQGLVDVAPSLAWAQTYSANDFGSAFLERYGWTELMGLRGPVASTQIAAGILLLGPETEYPLHSHEAEELYVPVAGTAQWKRGDGDWQARRPGEPIYHRPREPHAMQTEAEPLLALYVWRGARLAQKSVIL